MIAPDYDGSDILSEVLKYMPNTQRRAIGRSLSKRHYYETEHIVVREIMSKSVTDKEMYEYCSYKGITRVVMCATATYTINYQLHITDAYYVLEIAGNDEGDMTVEGHYDIEYTEKGDKSKTRLYDESLYYFPDESDMIVKIVNNTVRTFEEHCYGSYKCQPDDYQPIPTITPDIQALKWIYEQRLAKFGLNIKLTPDMLLSSFRERSDRYRWYLIAQCIVKEAIDSSILLFKWNRKTITDLEKMLCS